MEDRLTPTAGKILAQPTVLANLQTTSDLLAATTAANPMQDLRNLVNHFQWNSLIDLSASGIATINGATKILQIHLKPSVQPGSVATTLMSTGLYSFVSPNYIYPSQLSGRDLVEQVPNDPQFGSQFYHGIIGTPTAWDISTGSSSVLVALLDDGVDITHPDLINAAWSNAGEIAGDNLDNDGNGYIDDLHGWDFVSNTARVTPDDPNIDRHGTQVAGLLAASFNNAVGGAGVAGNARFLPLKIVGNGPTTLLTIARAVNYALDREPKIINNSINIDGFTEDPVFQAAVESAVERGALWINSAGNLNLKDPPRAGLDGILVVSATDRNDRKTEYSNYGSGIDITAPGGTAADPLMTTIPGGGYGTAFGSSMAAPLIAGTAALIWSAYPTYTRDQVANTLLANADNLDLLNSPYEDLLGTGRVNAGKAVSGQAFATKLGRILGMPLPGQNAPADFDHFSLRLLGNLDATTINISSFELKWAGHDNVFETFDDQIVGLNIENDDAYQYGTNALDFTLAHSLTRGLYRFTAFSGGLRDPFNTPVDGDGDGAAGGNLVRFFGLPLQVQGTVTWDIDEDGEPDPDEPPATGGGIFADLNNNGNWDTTTVPGSPGTVGIPDLGTAEYSFDLQGFSDPLAYLSLSLQLSHAAPSDLEITLIAPDGRSVILIRNRMLPTGIGDNREFIFDENAKDTVNGVYRLHPAEALSALYGIDPNGTWTIVVKDTTAGDDGFIIGARITAGVEAIAFPNRHGDIGFDNLPENGNIALRPFIPDGWTLAPGSPAVVNTSASRVYPIQANFSLFPSAGISGTLIDDVHQTGIANATITIVGTGISTTTDAFGHYHFPGLPEGTYTLKVEPLPGYSNALTRSVTLAAGHLFDSGNDFHINRDTTPVRVDITPVTPDLRTSPVDSITFTLSEALPGLSAANLRLTRDGVPVNLGNATLVGSGLGYTLIGLGNLTGIDGDYALTVIAPAPVGDPGRQPDPAQITWTLDTAAPTATLTPVVGAHGIVDQFNVIFNSPVNGVDITDFILKRGSTVIPITGASLNTLGANAFTLTNLALSASEPGAYRLELLGPGITDMVGNALVGTVVADWMVPTRIVKFTAVGAGEGSLPSVAIFAADGSLVKRLTPFDGNYTGGVRVATGDVNGDGVDDIIVSQGRNTGPRVKVFDGRTFAVLSDLTVFEANFRGGVFVAAGDVTGDGLAELIVTPDKGGGPRVRVLNALTGSTVADFFGIQDVNFRGGARASLGDVTGDGRMDVIVAAGTGGGPRVAVFDGVSVAGNRPAKPFGDFLAFEPNLRNGAYVTAADLDGDGRAEIIAGAGDGGGPRLSVFSGADLMSNQYRKLSDFFVGDVATRGGLRLSVKDLDGDGVSELLVGPGHGTGSRIRVYAARNLMTQPNPATMREFDPFGGFLGGVYLG